MIATRDPAVLIIRYDWPNNSVLFVHNLDERRRQITFSAGLSDDAGKLLVNLLSEDHSQANEAGKHTLVFEPDGYRWYRVEGLDETERHRHRRGWQGKSSGLERLTLPMSTPSSPRKSSAP